MASPTLHYLYDPLCGWCYAASPLLRAAVDAGISTSLHGGGLFAKPTRVSAEKRTYMRQGDARIAAMTGVVFGPAYLDGLLADPNTLFWSRPPIAAILAAGAVDPGSETRMLAAIQQAHYVEGRRVLDDAVLADVSESIGLPSGPFEEASASTSVDKHVNATQQLMARLGVQGFPAFFVERNGVLNRVDHQAFYGRPGEFARYVTGTS